MPTEIPEVTADPIEREVYHVRSSRPGEEPYRVDMEEFGGHGWCACRDFEIRHQPKLVAAQESRQPIPLSQCKHISKVEEFRAWRGGR